MNLARIAFRNLRRNLRRTAITAFAVFLGVGVMLSVRGFLNAVQDSMLTNTVHARFGAVQVHKSGWGRAIEAGALTLDVPDDPAQSARIRAVPGVTGVAPRLHFPAMASRGDETVFVLATAVDPVREYVVCPEARNLVTRGSPLGATPGAILSEEVAKALGVAIGDPVVLLANDRDGVLNGIEVPLVGVFQARFPGMERTIVVSLPEAQALLRMEGRVTELAVSLDDARLAPRAVPSIAAAAGTGTEVRDWTDFARFLFDVMDYQNSLLSIVSAVFLVVALAGIVNTMLMSVLERRREIGTMLALGIRRREVARMFVLEGAALGAVGGLAGAAAGWALTAALGAHGLDIPLPGSDQPNLMRPFVPIWIPPASAAIGIAGASLASLWPAYRASRLSPVEALVEA